MQTHAVRITFGALAIALALLALGCSQRSVKEQPDDVEARRACDAVCARFFDCGVANYYDAETAEECSNACVAAELQPWTWTDCREESLAMQRCNGTLSCEDLDLITKPAHEIDPIESRPCYDDWWQWGGCANDHSR